MGREPRWKAFLRDWMLPIAIVLGISIASVYHAVPALHRFGPVGHIVVADGQRWVIATLLFFQFVKISPHDVRPRRWHLYILLFQIFCFISLALLARSMEPGGVRILVECAMLCLICPTASAAGVITERLGGQLAGTVTYLVMINLVGTLLIPSVIPMVQPSAELGFWAYVLRIAGKIFPVLIVPAMLAWVIRYTWGRLQRALMRLASYSFYVWGVGLTFAMILSTHSLICSGLGGGMIAGIVAVSALCCLIQFLFGRWAGYRAARFAGVVVSKELRSLRSLRPLPLSSSSSLRDNSLPTGPSPCPCPGVDRPLDTTTPARRAVALTAGQTLGQKNTGFLIWLGYTYLTPVTAVAGGLYAIWQNLFNAWELYEARQQRSISSSAAGTPAAHGPSREPAPTSRT